MEIRFRDGEASDQGYIYDSWLKEYRQGPFGSSIESDVYFPNYRKQVERILISSTITIAHPEDAWEQICAYAVHRKIGDVRVLSWMFVKGSFRSLGIGKLLYAEIGGADVVTHISKRFKSYYDLAEKRYVSKLPPNVVYNPFLDLKLMESA